MKQVFLFLILLGLNFFAKGQDFISEKTKQSSESEFSLLDPSNFWSVVVDTTSVPVPNFDPYKDVKSTWYKFGKDTTINNMPVKTLLNMAWPHFYGWAISGYFRQDGSKIYFWEGNREILLYDFGLSVGETFKSAIHPDFSYISRLDSVRDTTLNNSVRKIYYLTEYPDFDPSKKQREVWVEGIGSISDGLLRQTMLGSPLDPVSWPDYQLMCFHQDDKLIYQMKRYKVEDNYTNDTILALLSTDKLWSTMKGPMFECPTSFFCASNFTKLEGDTLIDDHQYLKALCSVDEYMQNWRNCGLIREDSNHQVYFRDYGEIKERLIYNFNCKPGEIIHLETTCSGDYLVDSIVTKIDLGTKRRHIYLNYISFRVTHEEWIEGVGSKWGILSSGGEGNCLIGSQAHALLCYFEKNKKMYQSNEFPNYCYINPEIINGIAPAKTVSQFKVYPNPVSDELFLQPISNIDEGYTLELYSVKGELVKTECLDAGMNLYRIDVNSLRNGIYILRLISATGKYDEEIILKE